MIRTMKHGSFDLFQLGLSDTHKYGVSTTESGPRKMDSTSGNTVEYNFVALLLHAFDHPFNDVACCRVT